MNRKILLIFAVFALTFLVLPAVSAATTLNNPESGTNQSTTMVVNCTTAIEDALNVTIFYNASGGTTYLGLTDITNTTDGQTEFYDSATDISGLTDATTYNFSCTAANASLTESSAGVTIVTIDNTDPSVSLNVILGGDHQDYGREIEYTCTTSDAIDSSETTSFSVTHPSGDTTSSTSLTADGSSHKFKDTDYSGEYVFTCSATDDAGNTASSSSTVTVDELGRAIKVSKSNNYNMLLRIGVIIAIIVFASFYNKK